MNEEECDQGMQEPFTSQTPIVILGAGYTGRYLRALTAQRGLTVVATSRSPETKLADLALESRAEFDLARPDTWDHIPRLTPLIWCFPATPIQRVDAFASAAEIKNRRVVVLGSTSAYGVSPDAARPRPDRLIEETDSIDRERPRVQGEELLRLQHGAIVLRVAGIYGPGRNVLDWIRQGRVRPSSKQVNLIHVEDLAGICLAALERGRPGESYNVSDGLPRRWVDICQEAERRWNIPMSKAVGAADPGKRISTRKLHAELTYQLRHPDLFTALEALERGHV